MLFSGSGDHLCDPVPALLWAVACLLPSLSLAVFPVFIYLELALRV
jgi:hypothetical protein